MPEDTLLKLFESRLRGEERVQFGLIKLDSPLGEQQPYATIGGQTVYRIETKVPYNDSTQYITDPTTRKESIKHGVATWGAAGFLPMVRYGPESIDLALLWRDSGAPSWPNHYTLPSGLSSLIDGVPESLNTTAKREFEEELIFLDKRNTKRQVFKEVKVPYRVYLDGKTRVEVYRNGRLMDVVYPFAIGWGTPEDTVTTTIDSCVMFPDLTIDNSKENLQVINGEVVDRKTGKTFSRTTALVNFLDIYERRLYVRVRRFSIDLDENKVNEEYIETEANEMKFPYYLKTAVEKLKSLSDEELSDILKI